MKGVKDLGLSQRVDQLTAQLSTPAAAFTESRLKSVLLVPKRAEQMTNGAKETPRKASQWRRCLSWAWWTDFLLKGKGERERGTVWEVAGVA